MKISRNDLCRGGSGNKYKKCCLPKSIKEDGLIPITSEIQEILDKENDRFKAIMGRDISGDDPLMPLTLKMSESEYKRNVTEMLNEIGVDPRVIYAFNKLGYCLVEGEEMYSEEQIEQWNEAIEEYEVKEINGEDTESQKAYSTIGKVYKTLDKLRFLYALIVRKYNNKSNSIDLVVEAKPSDYILFCLTRNLKSLKAINLLAVNDFPEDALNLTRTNFENYAEIVYSKYDGDTLRKQLIAENGVYIGTHERKWKKLVDKKNGEGIILKNNYEKVNLHPIFKDLDSKIYNLVYSHLSSFTHPDIKIAIQYIERDRGFTDLKENSNIDPMIIALILNFMIIHELQDLEFFKTSKDDLIQQNREIADALNFVHEHIGKLNQDVRKRIRDTINTYS
jgi:hypothetical protein